MRMSANKNLYVNSKSVLRNNMRQWTATTQQLEANARNALRRLPVVLSEQQIQRLQEHKYSSEGTTLLDPFMQKFWKWLVEYCPLWVAPNLVTSVGLAVNIVASVLLMIATNGGTEQCSRWVHLLAAFGLFVYQSLDAIDGKQARRTNSSTPLGELFDHGCDSISTVFVTVACCCALQLGTHPWLMFWCCMFSYFTFYCAHWQTYVSGMLKFGKLDCTEAQYVFIFTYFLGFVSPGFWSTIVPVLNIESRVLVGYMAIISSCWNAGNNLHSISKGGCGRSRSSVADTSIIFPIWPIGFLIFLAYIASNHSLSHELQDHPVLLLLCYGIAFSKITNRLIVAYMSKSPLNAWDSAYIGPLAVCINQYFSCAFREEWVFFFFFIYNLCDALRYNIKVCQELCDALDIHCFRIKSSKPTSADNLH